MGSRTFSDFVTSAAPVDFRDRICHSRWLFAGILVRRFARPSPTRRTQQPSNEEMLMRARSAALFAIGAVSGLMLAGVGHAADGSSFLLGRVNTASRITTLSNPSGSTLSLLSNADSPPLRVNSHAKVAHLNADLLDGRDSSAFALTGGRTGVIVGNTSDDDGLATTAACPAGTFATGGGGYATGPRDYLDYSGPAHDDAGLIVPNSWLVVADGDATAWVVCYNPRGAVPGAASHISAVTAQAG
jgi:hypothetical protein